MFESLKYLTVGAGCIACFCSFSLFIYFMQSPKHVSRSVAYVYLAESCGLAITVFFSIGAGVYRWITPGVEMGLRWLLFTSAVASSVHMARSINGILRGHD